MGKRAKRDGSERMLAIVRDPIYKRWTTALRAYDRAVDRRSRDEIEPSAVHRARDKVWDAQNHLRALSLTPAEMDQEEARARAIGLRLERAEEGAAAARHARRSGELDALRVAELDDPHTRYVPGVGYTRGRRVL